MYQLDKICLVPDNRAKETFGANLLELIHLKKHLIYTLLATLRI